MPTIALGEEGPGTTPCLSPCPRTRRGSPTSWAASRATRASSSGGTIDRGQRPVRRARGAHRVRRRVRARGTGVHAAGARLRRPARGALRLLPPAELRVQGGWWETCSSARPQTVAEYNGTEKASHVKDKLVEMNHLNETLYCGCIACASEGRPPAERHLVRGTRSWPTCTSRT